MRLPFQLDRYTLVELIGAGAFGRVYRAEVRGDMGFVSEVAVKVLDANVVATNPNVARQMADEARILSQLDHPNIVKVIDFKHVDHTLLGDIYFMVMEYVRGLDVSQILEHMEDEGGEMLPATAVLHLGLMASDALVHAHEFVSRDGHPLQLVHRDLKPQNLMVNFRGQVKVLDFGIAKAKDRRMAQRTQEGQTKGTVFYMSPEQLAGEELDARSDLYSMGTILFEMLRGQRLLDVEVATPADLARAMHMAFELDVDARLDILRAHLASGKNGPLGDEAVEGWIGLLRATLHKDPRYRPDSASMLSEQLEWLRGRHPTDTQRDYWSRTVSRVAQARAADLDDPTLDDPRPLDVEDVDEPSSGAYAVLGSSTHEFFGMQAESPFDDEDSGPGHGPVEVPVTRQMSVVRGTVRTFGSTHVQEIGPLPELLKEIDITSRSSIKVVPDPDGSAGGLPTAKPRTTRPMPARPTTVETDGVKAAPSSSARSRDDLAVEARAKAVAEARQAPQALAAAKTVRKRPAGAGGARKSARNKQGPDRRVVFAVAASLLVLLAVLIVVVATRAGSDSKEGIATTANTKDAFQEAVSRSSVEATPDAQAIAETTPAVAKPPSDTTAEDPTPEATAEVAAPVPKPVATKPRPRPRPKPKPKVEATPSPAAEKSAAPAQFTIGARPTETTGTLHLAATPRCRIEINDQYIGTSDETRRGVAVSPGTYVIRFRCDPALDSECAKLEKKGAKKTLRVEANKAKRFRADFFELNESR